MAVSAGYLAKIQRAVRIKHASDEIKAELAGLVEEGRADLVSLGVSAERVTDESDPLVFGALRCYTRWKTAPDRQEADGNRDDYMLMRDELRRRIEYAND